MFNIYNYIKMNFSKKDALFVFTNSITTLLLILWIFLSWHNKDDKIKSLYKEVDAITIENNVVKTSNDYLKSEIEKHNKMINELIKENPKLAQNYYKLLHN